MAYEGALTIVPGLKAGADLSAKQFCAVLVDTDGDVILAGAGDVVVGVLQDKPAADGRAASVAVSGVTKMSFGDTVAPGDLVASDANGQGVPATGGDYFFGVCEIGGDADEIGSVILGVNGLLPPA